MDLTDDEVEILARASARAAKKEDLAKQRPRLAQAARLKLVGDLVERGLLAPGKTGKLRATEAGRAAYLASATARGIAASLKEQLASVLKQIDALQRLAAAEARAAADPERMEAVIREACEALAEANPMMGGAVRIQDLRRWLASAGAPSAGDLDQAVLALSKKGLVDLSLATNPSDPSALDGVRLPAGMASHIRWSG